MNSFRSFSEIEEFVTGSGIRKTIALAGAHDSYALDSVIHARKKGLIEAILIGHAGEIRRLLEERGEREADYRLIDCQGMRRRQRRRSAWSAAERQICR